jgi:hypothetical protein
MLADLIHSRRIQNIRTHTPSIISKNYLLLVLVGAASLSLLLYWLAFVQPYGLIPWRHYNQLDLQRISLAHPAARWYLLLAFVEQSLVYLIAWRAARELKGRAAWLVVLGGALAMGLLLLFMFPLGADDVFDNIMHGRIVTVYRANPYVQFIAQYGRDPIQPYVGWPYAPSAYGPLWEMLAGATAWLTNRLAGADVVANVLAFKLIGGLFLAGSVGLVAGIVRRVSPERALQATLLLAWNPVVLYETMGNGHNDIVMVFFVLAAVWALLTRRHTLAILALMAGGLIKFMPVLLIPAAGLIALRDLPDLRARARFVLIGAALSLALVVAAYAPFWQGPRVLSLLRREQLYTTSWATVAYEYLARLWNPARAASVVSKVALGWTALFAIAMGFRAFWDRGWDSFARSAFYTFIFFLMVTVPWFQNWYSLWPLGLAVVMQPGRAARLGYVFAFATLSKPFIFGPMFIWPIPIPPEYWRELRLGPAVMAVPLAYALWAVGDEVRCRVGHALGRPKAVGPTKDSSGSPALSGNLARSQQEYGNENARSCDSQSRGGPAS